MVGIVVPVTVISDGSTTHSFEVISAEELEYDVPLLYYKGYRAFLKTAEKTIDLPVRESDHGTILVLNQGRCTETLGSDPFTDNVIFL